MSAQSGPPGGYAGQQVNNRVVVGGKTVTNCSSNRKDRTPYNIISNTVHNTRNRFVQEGKVGPFLFDFRKCPCMFNIKN
jgi:hypothetical protein